MVTVVTIWRRKKPRNWRGTQALLESVGSGCAHRRLVPCCPLYQKLSGAIYKSWCVSVPYRQLTTKRLCLFLYFKLVPRSPYIHAFRLHVPTVYEAAV